MMLLKLLRIHHWIKNLFVFLPVFFSGNFLEVDLLIKSLWAFISFCAAASLIYIINDYQDIEKDRLHPVKKDRPLASGAISKRTALLLTIPLIIILAFMALFVFSPIELSPLLAYIVLNILYSVKLKNVAILDVAIIAFGFVLRVIFGGIVTGIEVSKWAFLLTFSLALVLALGKRRGEMQLSVSNTRKALHGYSVPFVDAALVSSVTITIVCYIMYAISEEVVSNFGFKYIYATVVFVILGIFRYLQQTIVFNRTESPTRLVFKDLFLQIMLLLWILTFTVIIYFS